MYLFSMYLDENYNLTNIIISRISKENQKTFNIDLETVTDPNMINFIDRNPKILNVIHDIRKIRNDDTVTVYDNDRVVIGFKYVANGGYLKKVTDCEKMLTNKEKIKMIKFNKSGSITCNFGDEDKTYNNKDSVVYTAYKVKNKSLKTNRYSAPIDQIDDYINIALKEMLTTVNNSSDIHLRKFIYSKNVDDDSNGRQDLTYVIDADGDSFEKLEEIFIKAVEKYTIFLNFERED